VRRWYFELAVQPARKKRSVGLYFQLVVQPERKVVGTKRQLTAN
jgi:hypothetical protein